MDKKVYLINSPQLDSALDKLQAIAEKTSNLRPLILSCDIALDSGENSSDTTKNLLISNMSGSFSDIVNAHDQDRSVFIEATYETAFGDVVVVLPLIGYAKNGNQVFNVAFRAPIPNDIMQLIYPSWAAYDCFVEISYGNGFVASLVCNSSAIASEIGDIETLLSLV